MGAVRVPFERRPSPLFGIVHRPIVTIEFWSRVHKDWTFVTALVDAGADYTLLPHQFMRFLGVDVKRDCEPFMTFGVGGAEKVFLCRSIRMRLGPWQRKIPVGFLSRLDVPPLLGRQGCLETFRLTFHRWKTIFSHP